MLAGCLSYPREPAIDTGQYEPASLYATNYRVTEQGREYFNPWRPFEPRLARTLRLSFTRNPYGLRRGKPPPVRPTDAGMPVAAGSARVTWVGHATVMIEDDDAVVLTDPNFSSRIWTIRRAVKPGIEPGAIPPDAMAVISHSHRDHLDENAVMTLPPTLHWFVPAGQAGWFRERGRNHVTELGWWQSAERRGWRFTCLPAQHWSSGYGFRFNETLWCSWLIESAQHRYFYGGDTGYFHGFAEFRRRYGPIDVAILPIGAYEPRPFLGYQHMDPAQAWRAFDDLGARHLIPVHWGTFRLGHEPLDEPPRALMRAVGAAGGDPGRLHLLDIGAGWLLPGPE